jgi:hypothetical protein
MFRCVIYTIFRENLYYLYKTIYFIWNMEEEFNVQEFME